MALVNLHHYDPELELLLGLGNPCSQLGTSKQEPELEPELEPEGMMGELSSYILFPVHWFEATSRECTNPAKYKFKVIVLVPRAVLRKDLGTRVGYHIDEGHHR